MDDTWESEIGGLLTELADVQTALLGTFSEKRKLLATGDQAALTAIGGREKELASRLQSCHERREQLLARAGADGVPADSIMSLSDRLPAESRDRVQASIRESTNRSKMVQHQCLANWVLVQRMLLHLSQLIEIIATGGQGKPTYGNGSERQGSGFLVDRAV